MKRLLFALLLFSLGKIAAESPPDLARATIVIYNRSAPESEELAHFYTQARRLPNDHLIGLDCSTEEEISRQEYDQTIAEPLRKIFSKQNWWTLRTDSDGHPSVRSNRIHFVALIRGMPLKIRSTADYPGDKTEGGPPGSQNHAALDSELAVLGLFAKQISGATNNPYFQSFRPIMELEEMPIMLVGRLDAPTAAIVRRMITDAIAVEQSGLWGRAYVDAANNTSSGLADGDQWLKAVVKELRQVGIPTVEDTEQALFPAGFPMTDCVLYYGWYAGDASGPFADPDFAFTPGAVAVHIHSFSANTLRSSAANWVAPLLSKGAAASLGNVYEPYLQLTAHLDILNDRLLHGFTFAESASMSQPALSWMNVALGDPLYRPYARWLQIDARRDDRAKNDWRIYHDFAVINSRREPADYLATARKAALSAGNGPMIEDLGLIEKESGNFSAAVSSLQRACSLYSKPDDILRAVLEQAGALIKAGDKKGALELVRNVMRLIPDAPATALLRKIEQQLNPPRASPTPSPL